jgi:hypothetical protein
MPRELSEAIDAFAADQRESISRPQALRLILSKFLGAKGYLPK